MLLALAYYAVLAVDRYASSALVVVRQTDESQSATVPGLAMLMGGTNPTSREETLFLTEYIKSPDLMNELEQRVNWVERYSGQWRDPFFWISADADAETKLAYYQRIVQPHFDDVTGLLRVEVQSFDPQLAQDMLKVILESSESFVNEISHRIARDHMKFAADELLKARRLYDEKQHLLLEFQNKYSVLDAQASAQSRAGIITQIETSLSQERATLKGLEATLNPNSPQVRQQRNRIAALEGQLQAEQRRLVSAQGDDKMNLLAAEFRNLTIDASVAEEAYKLAITAQQNARIEATRKIRTLVTIATPNLPERAAYPEALYNLLTILIVLGLLYGIARFIITTIEDHRD
ncbi:ABC transporter permease [Bordetella sp. BOR01]|uniref:ABC transporter permease n=1 Tax=Bordetella sp. BOR01 TaxID=2854779 RepID=UPI0021070940|nr:ABC transporter permease [Bordetella sp. BOR01]